MSSFDTGTGIVCPLNIWTIMTALLSLASWYFGTCMTVTRMLAGIKVRTSPSRGFSIYRNLLVTVQFPFFFVAGFGADTGAGDAARFTGLSLPGGRSSVERSLFTHTPFCSANRSVSVPLLG